MNAVLFTRLETPELQPAHRSLLDWLVAQHAQVLVVLDLEFSDQHHDNAYDALKRGTLLKTNYSGIKTIGLGANERQHDWSTGLDAAIDKRFGGEPATIYTGRADFAAQYRGRHTVQLLPQHLLGSADLASGAWQASSAGPHFDPELLHHWQHTGGHVRLLPSVDVAPLSLDGTHVVLAWHKHTEQWTLPSGYQQPGDADPAAAAWRIFTEYFDAEIPVADEMSFVYLHLRDHWRYLPLLDLKLEAYYAIRLASVPQFGPLPVKGAVESRWLALADLDAFAAKNPMLPYQVQLLRQLQAAPPISG